MANMASSNGLGGGGDDVVLFKRSDADADARSSQSMPARHGKRGHYGAHASASASVNTNDNDNDNTRRHTGSITSNTRSNSSTHEHKRNTAKHSSQSKHPRHSWQSQRYANSQRTRLAPNGGLRRSLATGIADPASLQLSVELSPDRFDSPLSSPRSAPGSPPRMSPLSKQWPLDVPTSDRLHATLNGSHTNGSHTNGSHDGYRNDRRNSSAWGGSRDGSHGDSRSSGKGRRMHTGTGNVGGRSHMIKRRSKAKNKSQPVLNQIFSSSSRNIVMKTRVKRSAPRSAAAPTTVPPSTSPRSASRSTPIQATKATRGSDSESATDQDHGVGAPATRKSLLYAMLSPKSKTWPAMWFRRIITTIIVLDFVAFIALTEPSIQENDIPYFRATESIISTIFFWEYMARLYTITEHKNHAHPIVGRLRYIFSPSAILDACATFSFFLEELTGMEMPRLTYLRIFRLVRILKTNGMMQAIDAVWRVMYYNRQILYVAVFVCFFLVLFTSFLLYVFRPRQPYAELEEFQSILSTMYLATLMLTGQGGPEVDLPWYTKFVLLVTSVFSIGMFAVPASMLTWGFEAEAARCAKRARQLSKRQSRGEYISDDDYSTDEEYQKIIAGEESDDSSDSDSHIHIPRSNYSNDASVQDQKHIAEEMRRLLERFRLADKDGSGSISMQEYLALARMSSVASMNPLMVTSRQESIERRLDQLEAKLDKMGSLLEKLVGHMVTENASKVKDT